MSTDWEENKKETRLKETFFGYYFDLKCRSLSTKFGFLGQIRVDLNLSQFFLVK